MATKNDFLAVVKNLMAKNGEEEEGAYYLDVDIETTINGEEYTINEIILEDDEVFFYLEEIDGCIRIEHLDDATDFVFGELERMCN